MGDNIFCFNGELFCEGLVDVIFYYDGERSHGDFGDKIFCYTGELFRDGLVDEIFYYSGEPTTASASTAMWATIPSALTASSL